MAAATRWPAERPAARPGGLARTICARVAQVARQVTASRLPAVSTAEPSATVAATLWFAAPIARPRAAAGVARTICAKAAQVAPRSLAWRRARTTTVGRSGTAAAGRSPAARPAPRPGGCATRGCARPGQPLAACRRRVPLRPGINTAVTSATGVDQRFTVEPPAARPGGPAKAICARLGLRPAVCR